MRELEQDCETAAHWSAAQYDALFFPDAQDRVALIATDEFPGASIMGFLIARCLPEEWEIENVVVDERHRQRGVGTSLVRKLLADAGAAGVESAVLEVRESNRPAVLLYENIGFKTEGRRKNYYQAPTEDALLYRLKIADL
ncbi:MAG TPA: GNAT family N-acetyltransferase [Terriglobales bacterium]